VDLALVERGLATSRARAQELLRRHKVLLGGRPVTRPSTQVGPEEHLEVTGDLRFVSRGGDKLDAACDALRIDVRGKACLDVGASTGGFTDCLLQRGASAVCAVDVGRDQLAPALRADPRVTVLDETNVRELSQEMLPFVPALTVVDASFISLGTLAPSLAALLDPGAELLALVKPQFEVGASEARRRKGVVPKGPLRDRAIADAGRALDEAGFEILGETDSAVAGPKGNVERFVHARRR
jgi:23S rRNA (cytidine1920-2'-O)/16S rRNA (cytidine1409-2'-O)-methyltransferase